MSFWSGETLAAKLPTLVDPFDAGRIDCAAYTLRVGAEIYISPTNSAEATGATKRTLQQKEGFVIPPGQFALLLTEECVSIPSDAVGFISMKARIKFRGLINVSGFHVDPGYSGHLVFSVFNAGPSMVHLARGDDCFLIWYASLDAESAFVRKAAAYNGVSSELINSNAGPVLSLSYLSNRLDLVEKEHQLLRLSAATVLAIGLTLLAILGRGCLQQVAPPTQPVQLVGPESAPPQVPPLPPATEPPPHRSVPQPKMPKEGPPR